MLLSRFSSRSCFAGLTLSLGMLLLAGCGSSSAIPAGPKGTVTGKVTLDGEAVPAGSTVMFLHEETSLGATGTTTGDGTYSLTMLEGDQLPVGSYKISVTPPDQGAVDSSNEEAYAAAMEGGGEEVEASSTIPVKYHDTESSELTYTVTEGPNTHNIELESE
jgi:hypothetical protein